MRSSNVKPFVCVCVCSHLLSFFNGNMLLNWLWSYEFKLLLDDHVMNDASLFGQNNVLGWKHLVILANKCEKNVKEEEYFWPGVY